jgi:hypothetical protein
MPVTFNVGAPKAPSSVSASGYASAIASQMQQIENAYEQLFTAAVGASPEIIYSALIPTKALAEYYTPVKTGKLRASSYLEVTDRGEMPRVELGFARNGDPPYAAYVHEMVQNVHASPTRSKFLQAAVLEDMDNVKTRIINGYKSLAGL